jgi:nucleotide-binding universal stress UspA family protein
MTNRLSGICSQADEDRGETNAVRHSHEPPIVAGVDESSASAAALDTAVGLADELDAPIVFVYVRRGPAGFLGEPVYQRRLRAEMARARGVLDQALKVAAGAGVEAEGMILEGSPERRIAEIARDRGARLVVVGSRRYKLGRGVSTAVVRSAGRPVVVAARGVHAVAAVRPAA